jgi:hypothetical protein
MKGCMIRGLAILLTVLFVGDLRAELPANEPLPPIPPISIDVPTLSRPENREYQVVPNGNNLELITPFGKRILFGDRGLRESRGYRIEIPLSELRPPEPPKVPPEREVASTPREDAGKNLDGAPKDESAQSSKGLALPEKNQASVPLYDDTDRLILEANRLYNRGKFYAASLTVEDLISKRPDYARAWVMKGSLMYVQGQKDLAKTAWKKAIELDPSNEQVKAYLGRLK